MFITKNLSVFTNKQISKPFAALHLNKELGHHPFKLTASKKLYTLQEKIHNLHGSIKGRKDTASFSAPKTGQAISAENLKTSGDPVRRPAVS